MSALSETGDAPLISVITATWNLLSQGRQEPFRRVIDCMARQNCVLAEHVIQDGASDDGTVPFIQELIAGRPRTRLVSEPDAGLYDAMNRGVTAARGEYVLFLNSDDALASDDVLSRAADLLQTHRPDYLYGPSIQRLADGGERRERRMSHNAILQRMPFCHNSVFLRRDMFLELGGHDTHFRIAADYDLVLRMVGAGYRGLRMEQPISLFWERGETSDDKATGLDYARVWQAYYARYKSAATLTLEDYAEFYRRGHMPVSLIRDVLANPQTPAAIRVAARHSLQKSLRRAVQFWRRF